MKTFTIGRDYSNQIVLDDNFVSRHHAQLIIMDNGQVVFKDLGSANGSFVNGNRITEAVLNLGDIVKCGGAFLSWSQYVNVSPSNYTNTDEYQHQQVLFNQGTNETEIEKTTYPEFSLGRTLKYLTTKIFDIDDLFKTEWNKTPSILFFLLTPIIISLALFLYSYYNLQSKTQNDWMNIKPDFPFKIMFILLGFMIIIFGVSQFVTILLMSINRKMAVNKILFASSIFSFLQFIPYILFLLFTTSKFFVNDSFFNKLETISGYLIIAIIAITILICLLVTIIIFVYRYFRVIGVSKGVSIHFTIITFTLNLLVQSVLVYLLIQIIGENYRFI